MHTQCAAPSALRAQWPAAIAAVRALQVAALASTTVQTKVASLEVTQGGAHGAPFTTMPGRGAGTPLGCLAGGGLGPGPSCSEPVVRVLDSDGRPLPNRTVTVFASEYAHRASNHTHSAPHPMHSVCAVHPSLKPLCTAPRAFGVHVHPSLKPLCP